MGKLIVIEGTDSSGKQTQTTKLCERLKAEGENVLQISFPNYDSPASSPLKMYLAGEFGTDANSINPYSISTMFAIDRYASFKQIWEEFYNNGGIIIADRYTMSNMIHQGSKIEDETEKNRYINWLKDLEFDKMKLPEPDMVIFLDMPFEMSQILIKNRKNKITGEDKKDIHESDTEHLKFAYKNACEIAKSQNWEKVSCVKDKKLKTIDEINDNIKELVKVVI